MFTNITRVKTQENASESKSYGQEIEIDPFFQFDSDLVQRFAAVSPKALSHQIANAMNGVFDANGRFLNDAIVSQQKAASIFTNNNSTLFGASANKGKAAGVKSESTATNTERLAATAPGA